MRRFPPPWSVEEFDACFVVKDSSGQKLAYVYFEDEPGRRLAAKLLSKDEARCFERWMMPSSGRCTAISWLIKKIEVPRQTKAAGSGVRPLFRSVAPI
jgi:hypothetical protein